MVEKTKQLFILKYVAYIILFFLHITYCEEEVSVETLEDLVELKNPSKLPQLECHSLEKLQRSEIIVDEENKIILYLKRYSIQFTSYEHQIQIYDYFNGNLLTQGDLNYEKTFNVLYYNPNIQILALYESEDGSENDKISMVFFYNYFELKIIPPTDLTSQNKAKLKEDFDHMHHFTIQDQPLVCRIDFTNNLFICDEYYKVNLSKQIIILDSPLSYNKNQQYQDQIINIFQRVTQKKYTTSSEEFIVSSQNYLLLNENIQGRKFNMDIDCVMRENKQFVINKIESCFICVSMDNFRINVYSFLPKPKVNQSSLLVPYRLLRSFFALEDIDKFKFFFFKNSILVSINNSISIYNTDAVVSSKQEIAIKPTIQTIDGEIIFIDQDQQTILTFKSNNYYRIWLNSYVEEWKLNIRQDEEKVEYVSSFVDETDNSIIIIGKKQINLEKLFESNYAKEEQFKNGQEQSERRKNHKQKDEDEYEEDLEQLYKKFKTQQELGYEMFQTFTVSIDRNTLENKFYLENDYRCYDQLNTTEILNFDSINQQYFLLTSCSHLIIRYNKQISEEIYHDFQDHQKLIVKTFSQKNIKLFYFLPERTDIFSHTHSSIKIVINNQILTNQISPPVDFFNNSLLEICTLIDGFLILFYRQDIQVYSYSFDYNNDLSFTLSQTLSYKIPYNLSKASKIDFRSDNYENIWAIALTFNKDENVLSIIDFSDIKQGLIRFPIEIQIKKSMGCISDQNREQKYFVDFFTGFIIAYGRYKLCIFNSIFFSQMKNGFALFFLQIFQKIGFGEMKKEININQKIIVEFNYEQHILLFIVQKGIINDLKNFGVIYDYIHDSTTEMKIEKLNPGVTRSARMTIIGYTLNENLINFILTDVENEYVYSYAHILNKKYLPDYEGVSFLERIKYTNECSYKTKSYERYFIKSLIFEDKNYIVNVYYDSIQVYQFKKYLKIILRLLYCILPESQEESTVKPYRNFLDLKIFEMSNENYYSSDIKQDEKDLEEDNTLLVMVIVFTNRITLYQMEQENNPEIIAYASFDQNINEIIELSEIRKTVVVLVVRSQNNLYTYKFHIRQNQQICSVDWSSQKQGYDLKNKNDILERSKVNYLFNHLKFPKYFYLNHGLKNMNQILDLSYISALKNIYLYYKSNQKYQMTPEAFQNINKKDIFAIHFESFELNLNKTSFQFDNYKSVVLDKFEIKIDENFLQNGSILIQNAHYVQISNFKLINLADMGNLSYEQNTPINYIFKFINCKKVKILNFKMRNFIWSSISSFFILESVKQVFIEKLDVKNNQFRGFLIRLNFIISAEISHLIFKKNKLISVLDVDNAEEQSTETTYIYIYNFSFSNSIVEGNEFSIPSTYFKYGGNIIHKSVQIINNTFATRYLLSFNPDEINIVDSIFDGNVLIQTNLIEIFNGKVNFDRLILTKNVQNAIFNQHYTLLYEQNAPQFPIILLKQSLIKIQQSKFQDNVIFFMLILAENSQIQVEQCKFTNNYCRNSNMGCCLSTQESQITLIHSIFAENLSVSGSAGKFFRCIGEIKIIGSLFQQNKAQFYGGALLLEQCSQIQIKKSTFTQNEAMIGGAIRYLQTYPYNFLRDSNLNENKIQNNEAYFYGQNIGSYIRVIEIKEVFEQYVDFDDQMSIIKKDFQVEDQNVITIFNFTSGRHLQINWEMADEERRGLIHSEIVDLNLKIIEEQDINEKEFEIIKKYDLKISSKNAKILSYQKAIEESILQIDINLVGEEEGKILAKITFPEILIPKKEIERQKYIYEDDEIAQNQGGENIFMFPLEVYLILEIRPCQQGETRIILHSRETKYFICQECLRGTFSKTIDPNQDTVCKKCDPQKSECFKNYLFTKKGYWRYQESIFSCPYPDSCIGGDGQGDDLCQEGYKGALCQSCDSNFSRSSKQFVRYGFYKCVECDSVLDKILILCLLSLLFLVFLIGIAYSSYQKSIKKLQIYYLTKMGMLSIGSSAQFFQSVFLAKLLLAYLPMIQLYRKYGSYLDTHVFDIWNKISMIFSQVSYSLECIVSKFFFKIGAFYPTRIVVTSAGPLLVLLVVFSITYLLNKKRLNKNQLKESVNTQLVLIIGLYYSCIAINNLLECLHDIKIEGKNFSLADTSIEVNDENYQMFLSYYIYVFIIFWTLIVPALLALKLFEMRNSLGKIKLNTQYGFLFQEYKTKYYFWDFVKLLVRNFIFFFVNLSGQEQLTEDGILIIITLILYIWSLIAFMPYQKRSHNSIDIALSCSSLVTAFLTTFGYDIEDKEKSLFKICEILTDLLNIVLIIFIIQSMEIMNIKRLRQRIHNKNQSWQTLKHWIELRRKILRYKSQQRQMKSASLNYLPIFDNIEDLENTANAQPLSLNTNVLQENEQPPQKDVLDQPFLSSFDGQL